jgi:hypothetical protein
VSRGTHASYILSGKRPDTVGQPPSAEIWVSKMPSLKAKKGAFQNRAKVVDSIPS